MIKANVELLKLVLLFAFEGVMIRKRKARKTWTEKYVLRRNGLGHSINLVQELATESICFLFVYISFRI